MDSAKSTESLHILSVSPLEDDHLALQAIVGHSKWTLSNAKRLPDAVAVLARHDVSVVLCERDLMPGRWTELLEHVRDLPHPPSLIVTSKLADERLWAEALNLGAWDVLAKPFDRAEIVRTVRAAWQHWHRNAQVMKPAVSVARAAS